jgi:predicted AAA+ superfamily ATPase
LSAHIAYSGIGGELSYWRTADGVEVDFLWKRGPHIVAFEVKSTTSWQKRDDAGMLAFEAPGQVERYGVYLGAHRLSRPWGTVYPITELLQELSQGNLLPASGA